MIRDGPAAKYAQWAAQPDNLYVPKYVKMQAKQWLDILNGNNHEAYVDEKAYKKMCKLLKIIIHPDLNRPMYDCLEDYAWLMDTAIFCTKSIDGSRYYKTILLEIARKNFKTFNSGIIFILLMLTEPMFSRFFSVAPDLKLSSELKNAITKTLYSSPALMNKKYFQLLASQIRCKITKSEYTPLAYSKDRMDGKLLPAAIVI